MSNYDDKKAYEKAKKRVEKEKGFYLHLMVYIVINSILLFTNSDFKNEGFKNWLNWQLYITPILWGIGLLSHGLSVFGKKISFAKKWEERKIQELMDKEDF
ncbi:2TM domain-containing protein [Aquimarina longa]|uniref:2TM domain-containing protein n=1 Tax=Aquimarina longa TaxID=1080221 RepID=UPI000A752510|nr:2TM domain-containing protein [Aquimarina longa]